MARTYAVLIIILGNLSTSPAIAGECNTIIRDQAHSGQENTDAFILTGRDLGMLNQDIPEYLLPMESMKDKKVLDVGCGSGAFVADLRSFGIEAFGVDPKIDPAEGKFLRKGRADKLPFHSESFDLVYSSFSIFNTLYIDEFTDAELIVMIKEINRVLRPLGRARLHTGGGFTSRRVLKLVESVPHLIGHITAEDKVVEFVYWPNP